MGTAGAPEGERKQVAKKWRILNKTSSKNHIYSKYSRG